MAGRFEDDGRRLDMLGFEEIPEKPENLNPQLPDGHIKERRLGKMTDWAAKLDALIETLEAQRPTTGDADAANPNSLPRYDANRLIVEAMKASESAPIPTESLDPEAVADVLRRLRLEYPLESRRVGRIQPLMHEKIWHRMGLLREQESSNELNPPKSYDQTIKEKDEDDS